MRLSGSDLACVRGGREVFAGVAFGVGAGEALMVTGPNGAGKSSLLRLVAGLVAVAAGKLALEGGDGELTIGEQAHYVGHQDALKSSLTVQENLTFWADVLSGGDSTVAALASGASGQRGDSMVRALDTRPEPGSSARAALASGASGQRGDSMVRALDTRPEPGSSARAALASGASGQRGDSMVRALDTRPEPGSSARAALASGASGQRGDSMVRALASVGLADLAHLPARYLSAGQRRRLAIARLVAVSRRIWLLDEPTSALDASAQAMLADLMRGHLAGGGLILAATHGPIGLDGAMELKLGARR